MFLQDPIAVIDVNVVLKHDSNAEISSLAGTVPSWTKAIERVINGTDMVCVSDREIVILTKELSELSKTINNINKIIEERTNAGN